LWTFADTGPDYDRSGRQCDSADIVCNHRLYLSIVEGLGSDAYYTEIQCFCTLFERSKSTGSRAQEHFSYFRTLTH
jgi:hypothetical protein